VQKENVGYRSRPKTLSCTREETQEDSCNELTLIIWSSSRPKSSQEVSRERYDVSRLFAIFVYQRLPNPIACTLCESWCREEECNLRNHSCQARICTATKVHSNLNECDCRTCCQKCAHKHPKTCNNRNIIFEWLWPVLFWALSSFSGFYLDNWPIQRIIWVAGWLWNQNDFSGFCAKLDAPQSLLLHVFDPHYYFRDRKWLSPGGHEKWEIE